MLMRPNVTQGMVCGLCVGIDNYKKSWKRAVWEGFNEELL